MRLPLSHRYGMAAFLLFTAPLASAQLPPQGQLPTLPDGSQPQIAAPMPLPAAAAAPMAAPVPNTPPPAGLPALPEAAPAIMPAGQLPALSNTKAAKLPGIQAEPAAPLPAAPAEPIRYSFGDQDISLFFTPVQVRNMKQALIVFESMRGKSETNMEITEAQPNAPVVPAIVEPPSYPVFYLSSIVFRAPGDWSIWVSGHKITPLKNDTDVKVISVSADRAAFAWSPSYAQALTARRERKLFAPTDPVKNKLSANPSFSYDDSTGIVTFTLRANQSFSAGYFTVFEGLIDSPAMASLAPAAPGAAATPVENPEAVAIPSDIKDMDRSAMDALLKQQQTMEKFAPPGKQ